MVIRGLEGIREAPERDQQKYKKDLQSDPRRSSLDMGIYGKWLGSVDLLGGVLSRKKTHQIGLSTIGIVVP